jgi:thioredoxin 1
MAGILTLSDTDWQAHIGRNPALILFTTGDGVRGDFSTAFKKAATEKPNIIFAQIDPTKNPVLAERFKVGDKPIMIGWYGDDAQVRRPRPWGTDVVLAIELLEKLKKEDKPAMSDQNNASVTPVTENTENNTQPTVVENTPKHVEQDNFNADIVEYSKTLPVLVDFWAEWCGPCRQVAPIMDKLAKEYAGKIRIAKIDTDANQGLAQALQIMSIPTIMAFKDGELVFREAGAFPEPAFRSLVDQLIALDVQAAKKKQDEQKNNPSN